MCGVNDEQCLGCGRRNPGMWGFAPLLNRLGRDLGLTPVVMWGCIVMYVVTLILSPDGIGNFLSPTIASLFLFGASGSVPVFEFGRWWTVLTAGWLHGGILHILFNMMSLRQIAPAVSEMYGASRMMLIYVVSGIT